MPLYVYLCDACGNSISEVRSIREETPDNMPCDCGELMYRDYSGGTIKKPAYDKPILSNALGINPAEMAEIKKANPHHEYTPDGRRVLRSHSEWKRALKEAGYTDKS